MEVMWWGSLLQSVGSSCTLRMRQSNRFLGARYLKRLEIAESSVGTNAAFVDSWVRAAASDYGELATWSRRVGRSGIVVVDLWESFVRGEDLSLHADLFEGLIARTRAVVFLMPRVHWGAWQSLVVEGDHRPSPTEQLPARLRTMVKGYESIINLRGQFGVVESGLTKEDFVATLGLDFAQSRKFAGLVHLIPRDLALGSFAFQKSLHVEDAVLGILARLLASEGKGGRIADKHAPDQSAPHYHLAPGPCESFCRGVGSTTSAGSLPERRSSLPLVRRHDGVWAAKSGWSLFYRTLQSPSLPASNPLARAGRLGALDRLVVLFLSRYEAHWSELNSARGTPHDRNPAWRQASVPA